MPADRIYRLIRRHTWSTKDPQPIVRRTHAKIAHGEVNTVERDIFKDKRVDGEECSALMELLNRFGERNRTASPHHFKNVRDARRLERHVLSVLSSEAAFRALPRADQKEIIAGMYDSPSVGFKVV